LCSTFVFASSYKMKKNITKKGLTHDSIELLLDACVANDRKAQIRLYELFCKSMYNVSYRIVKDQMLAEDIIQESFISAFKALKQFKREVPFHYWLKKIVINKSLDEIRRSKVFLTELNEEIVADLIVDDQEVVTDTHKMIDQLKKELFNMPDGYRIILSLYYLEGYDHEEISQILNITSSTSRSQLTRAKRMLTKRLTKEKQNND
jgi:RNA polymerase sigma factor (sigma-70 family)